MSNLPTVGASQQDIAAMTRLRQIMEGNANLPVQHEVQAHYTGGSQGTRRPLNESHYSPPPPIGGAYAGREEVDAMRNVLERFYAASGGNQNINETVEARTSTLEYATTPAVNHSAGGFEVRISLSEDSNGKETKNHLVVDSAGRVVVEGLNLVESAKAVMKLLNKGLAVNHARVTEVTELDEDYNRNRIIAGQSRSRYQRSVELNESAAAQVFKTKFETARASALAAQDQIKGILESIR